MKRVSFEREGTSAPPIGRSLSGVFLNNQGLIAFVLPLIIYGLVLRANSFEAHFLNVATQYAVWTTDVDVIVSNNQYYSAYAPGFAYLSIPFGIVGFLANGGNLTYNSYAMLTDEAFVALCAALASFVLYRICKLYAAPVPSLLASLTLAFGTIVWPFASVLFEHDVAMLFSLLGAYIVLKLSRDEIGEKRYLAFAAAGVFLGVASTMEYLSALLVLPLVLFLGYRRKLSVASGSLFLLTFIQGPLLDLAYNLSVTGSPLVFPEDLLTAANGQPALSRFELSNLLTVPVYNLLSPNRGLFLLSPVLLFGVYGLFRMHRSGKLKGEAMLLVSMFMLGLVPYSAWSDWLAGWSFGPRFMIDVIPYLVIPIAFALSEPRLGGTLKGKASFFSLFMLSSLIAGSAAFTSALPVEPNDNILTFYQPIRQSIPWLLQNNLDVWWHRFHPSLGYAAIVICFTLIWAVTWILLSSDRDIGKVDANGTAFVDSPRFMTQVFLHAERPVEGLGLRPRTRQS